jgi:uncharacterized membrane protein
MKKIKVYAAIVLFFICILSAIFTIIYGFYLPCSEYIQLNWSSHGTVLGSITLFILSFFFQAASRDLSIWIRENK